METPTIYVVAKYDYTAQEDQELSLKKNDRLKLLDDSKNWWKVINEIMKSVLCLPTILSKMFGGARSKSKSDFNEGGSTTYQSDFGSSSRSYNGSNGTKMDSLRVNAVAKFDYEPQREDELALIKGQTVIVLDKSSDGGGKEKSMIAKDGSLQIINGRIQEIVMALYSFEAQNAEELTFKKETN
uniref:SH3 domain-containing protein n=1 Tax=Ditylenchus dipsaci TaxID=166011 RepID=A0A915EQS7_9BILA